MASNVYSFPEELINLNNIYNEIESRHYLWERYFNDYGITIEYENILRMERKTDRFGIYYNYGTMVFEMSQYNEDDFIFHIITNRPGVLYYFVVFFKYLDGSFTYQRFEFNRMDQFLNMPPKT
ncbi:MAG: hypothetical protein FWC01_08220 [Treponema sp.]|nr:hypothetical protein [Treponema sp.]MCL2237895.1 hypothetical protein [Treponema sp.]